VYKPAFPHEKAISMVREGSGTHFDPEVADAFMEISGDIHQIVHAFIDEEGM